MGLLVDGKWSTKGYDTAATGGRYVRQATTLRNWITPDGAPGPSGRGGLAAEPGRYHLYVSLACPWAHRTLIFRALKGLTSAISLSVTHWLMGDEGWTFAEGPGVVADPFGARRIYEVYLRSEPSYSGRASVPVLWDKAQNVIVSNESSEIIRMLNSAFDGVGAAPGDFYRPTCAGRSTASTRASTKPSTMASTARASPPPRRLTRKRCGRCSPPWTCSRSG